MMYMLNAMLSLATRKHDGQFDKGGKPYILHVLSVMHKLRTEDDELINRVNQLADSTLSLA